MEFPSRLPSAGCVACRRACADISAFLRPTRSSLPALPSVASFPSLCSPWLGAPTLSPFPRCCSQVAPGPQAALSGSPVTCGQCSGLIHPDLLATRDSGPDAALCPCTPGFSWTSCRQLHLFPSVLPLLGTAQARCGPLQTHPPRPVSACVWERSQTSCADPSLRLLLSAFVSARSSLCSGTSLESPRTSLLLPQPVSYIQWAQPSESLT